MVGLEIREPAILLQPFEHGADTAQDRDVEVPLARVFAWCVLLAREWLRPGRATGRKGSAGVDSRCPELVPVLEKLLQLLLIFLKPKKHCRSF